MVSRYGGVSRGKLVIWDDILAERAAQDLQWGGPDHDDLHSVQDWRVFREKFEGRIVEAGLQKGWYAHVRQNLVKIAALTVAQIEALDRAYGSRFRQPPTPVQEARAEAYNEGAFGKDYWPPESDPAHPGHAEYLLMERARWEAESAERSVSSAVDHPSHYGGASNPYEVIKVLRAWYGKDIPAWMLMLMKYTYRAGKKDPSKEIEDLEKARWYLDEHITYLKREQKP